jgi:hypothetical protein
MFGASVKVALFFPFGINLVIILLHLLTIR